MDALKASARSCLARIPRDGVGGPKPGMARMTLGVGEGLVLLVDLHV